MYREFSKEESTINSSFNEIVNKLFVFFSSNVCGFCMRNVVGTNRDDMVVLWKLQAQILRKI